jgi:hypothetical protein
MPTQCSRDLFGYEVVEGRQVVAAFDGGEVTSDAGGLLLGATDRAIGLIGRFAACFNDGRAPAQVEHAIETMVAQRVFGIALGYEDVVDHDQLRFDPVLASLAGKLTARRKRCAPLAGKSTLNRLEHAPTEAARYHKIGHDGAAIERLFVDLFLEAHQIAPKEIVLDLDATELPAQSGVGAPLPNLSGQSLHSHQEGRFFHGYYDGYCYLPLYVFCGRHLLAAKLRRSNIDASSGAVFEVERIVGQIRARWPRVKILLRADSGFAREDLMAWWKRTASTTFSVSRATSAWSTPSPTSSLSLKPRAWPRPPRCAASPTSPAWPPGWGTGPQPRSGGQALDSWSRTRRVVAKAEQLPKGANPRFVVTSLAARAIDARTLYEDVYCARGEIENRMYGRLPPCKQVSSSLRHAWSAAAMYPAC